MSADTRRWLPLLLATIAAVAIAHGAWQLLRDRIEDNREREALAVVREALPLEYNNDLLRDRITVRDRSRPALSDPVSVFRARKDGRPVGLVMVPVRARGYSGTVELAVGIRHDGTLAGVRVQRQRETRGLGDRVHQQHSPWLEQFRGHSLEDTPPERWVPAGEGGAFDVLSGATITSRGVIEAVHSALEYHRLEGESLYR